MLNMYFASQSVIDDSNKTLHIPEPVQHTLESITITTQDVLGIFLHFDVSKACGPDFINPRLLKEGSLILSFLTAPSHKDTFHLPGKKPT